MKKNPQRYACTDKDALEWLRDGSTESENKAIDCLYRRLLEMIRPWIFARSGTSDDAHDAVTEAVFQFVRIFREGRYKEEGKLEWFIFRIAQRKFLDLLRKRGKHVLIVDVFPDGVPPEMEGWEDTILKEEKDMESVERITKLERCLNQIGERCRERIIQFWYH